MEIKELVGLLDFTKGAAVEIRNDGDINVRFFYRTGRVCIQFVISDHESHVEITHVESMCLPGRGIDWVKCLEAYHRAHLFCEDLKKYLQKQGKQLKEV